MREHMTNDPHHEQLVKSRQRVADHGEVFTPSWLVEDMLELVKGEAARIDARFLEPACGSGNFLVPVLERKLATAEKRYRNNSFERCHYALLALMSVYGIELLGDNAMECRQNLVIAFTNFIKVDKSADVHLWRAAANTVVMLNIIEGDALAMTNRRGEPIMFAEWSYLGKGQYQRRDFTLETLSYQASYKGTLFEELDHEDIFKPLATYKPMTVQELAK